jgi:hypothetical protein
MPEESAMERLGKLAGTFFPPPPARLDYLRRTIGEGEESAV